MHNAQLTIVLAEARGSYKMVDRELKLAHLTTLLRMTTGLLRHERTIRPHEKTGVGPHGSTPDTE